MPWSVDARVPVRFAKLENTPAGVVLLVEGDAPVGAGRAVERFTVPVEPLHPIGCVCCAARSPAAQALARLFLARARGEVEMFREVVVVATPEGEAAVRATLENDPLVSAWFRLASDG